MSAVLEFLPEAKCDAEEATRYYERCMTGLGARFAPRSRVSALPSSASRFCGVSARVATAASTFPDSLTTLHSSFVVSELSLSLLDMPAVSPTTGSSANSEN